MESLKRAYFFLMLSLYEKNVQKEKQKSCKYFENVVFLTVGLGGRGEL